MNEEDMQIVRAGISQLSSVGGSASHTLRRRQDGLLNNSSVGDTSMSETSSVVDMKGENTTRKSREQSAASSTLRGFLF